MKVYTLGCGGWIPAQNETSCFLVESRDCLIMLDAGTGVSNIRYFTDVLEKYNTLNIILTHYHLDHIIGLSYLLPYVENKDIVIYGPGLSSYQRSTAEILNDFFQPDFFSRALVKLAHKVTCVDYSQKPEFNIGEIVVNTLPQKHSSPSFSIQLDNELLYVTDTAFDASRWKCPPAVKLLLHECWLLSSGDKSQKHCSLEAIMNDLPLGSFKKVMLIHQNPIWGKCEINEILKRIEGTNITLANDLAIIEI